MAEPAAVAHASAAATAQRRRLRGHLVPQPALADRRDHRHRPTTIRGHPTRMVWPLLEVIDASCDEPLVQDAGHPSRPLRGRRGEASCGWAGATPSRVGSPGSSRPTPRQRPQLLIDWRERRRRRPRRRPATGSRRCGARCWTASTPTRPTSGTPKPLVATAGVADRPARAALAVRPHPAAEPPRSNCSTRWPPTTIFTCGCRTPATTCGTSLAGVHGADPAPRRHQPPRGRPPAAGHPRPRPARTAAQPARRPADRRIPRLARDRPDTLLGWLQSDITANARPARRPDARRRRPVACRCTAATARPARSTCCARCCSACSPTTTTLEPRDILVMCPDIETYAPLIVAGFGLGDIDARRAPRPPAAGAAGRPRRSSRPTRCSASRRNCSRSPAAGPPPARCSTSRRPAPVRARFGFTDDDLEDITRWVRAGQHPLGLRPASTASRTASTSSRTPGVSASTGCWPAWRCPTTRTPGSTPPCRSTTSAATASSWPAGSPSTSTGCSAPSIRSTGRKAVARLADRAGRRHRPAGPRRRRRRLADQPAAARVRRRARRRRARAPTR